MNMACWVHGPKCFRLSTKDVMTTQETAEIFLSTIYNQPSETLYSAITTFHRILTETFDVLSLEDLALSQFYFCTEVIQDLRVYWKERCQHRQQLTWKSVRGEYHPEPRGPVSSIMDLVLVLLIIICIIKATKVQMPLTTALEELRIRNSGSKCHPLPGMIKQTQSGISKFVILYCSGVSKSHLVIPKGETVFLAYIA